jgi:hypothetical protein
VETCIEMFRSLDVSIVTVVPAINLVDAICEPLVAKDCYRPNDVMM